MNSDRTMTLARQAVPPPGEALPDWQIIARVACAMGFEDGFSFASAAEVFAEASRFANPVTGYDISGVSHARLLSGPVQWPAAAGDEATRHPIRYRPDPDAYPVFATPSGKAVFLHAHGCRGRKSRMTPFRSCSTQAACNISGIP
nr:hypothetical protein [Acetobacter persici]